MRNRLLYYLSVTSISGIYSQNGYMKDVTSKKKGIYLDTSLLQFHHRNHGKNFRVRRQPIDRNTFVPLLLMNNTPYLL